MRIDFVTLFPEMIGEALNHSILKRGREKGILEFRCANPRDFTADKHRTVDDTPFGGGPGMLMMAEPIHQALLFLGYLPPDPSPLRFSEPSLSLRPAPSPPEGRGGVLIPDPTGPLLTQTDIVEWVQAERIAIVCGHYEGIDDRLAQVWGARKVSIGDYVITGGELPGLVIADAICRCVPGVLGDPESLAIDSFSDGLLSAPQFTRPETWNGIEVPEVLSSGNHGEIAKWKRRQALNQTKDNRPDLFSRARLEKSDLDLLEF